MNLSDQSPESAFLVNLASPRVIVVGPPIAETVIWVVRFGTRLTRPVSSGVRTSGPTVIRAVQTSGGKRSITRGWGAV